MSQPQETARAGYGRGLIRAATDDKRVVAQSAELKGSTRHDKFRERFPERFIEHGIAEADMLATAAGLASAGWKPHPATFACFVTYHGLAPIRQLISRGNYAVHITGTHAGIHTGEDGESAQCVEDTAVFSSLKNFVVVAPADSVEAEGATMVLAGHAGPSYQRMGRNPVPVIHDASHRFRLGTWELRRDGSDVTLIAHGPLVAICESAAALLDQRSISARVLNASTVKPIDRDAVLSAARATRAMLVAADEGPGGLYAGVTSILAREHPTRADFLGVEEGGETGSPDDLYRKYGFTPETVADRAARLLAQT